MDEYLILIDQLLKCLNESDLRFMRQIYTLLKKHLERTNGELKKGGVVNG